MGNQTPYDPPISLAVGCVKKLGNAIKYKDKINGVWYNDSNTNPGRPIISNHFGCITYLYQIALFDKHDKPMNNYITVDEDDLNLIKKHKWYLSNEIVVNENGVALTEILTSTTNVKLKEGKKCFSRKNLVICNDSINNEDIYIFTKIKKKDEILGMEIYCPLYPDKSFFKVVNEDYSIQESQIYALIEAIKNFSIFDKPLNIFTSNKNICSLWNND
ncbi:15807_t:CDS:2, partial [Dentiscutata erythropus]